MIPLLIKKTVTTKEVYKFVGKPFNPLTYDAANLLALYNGDVGLTAARWNDQHTGGHDIILFNAPTIVPNAINGHQAVQFNGINQYGQVATPNINQPSTNYIVFKSITWTNQDYIFETQTVQIGFTRTFFQAGISPNLGIYGGATLNSNPDLTIGSYGIMTCVFNGANSQIRTNDNVAVVGNAGANNSFGTTLAVRPDTMTQYGNVEIAYLIIRNGADTTAVQNNFINWLKSRFAI